MWIFHPLIGLIYYRPVLRRQWAHTEAGPVPLSLRTRIWLALHFMPALLVFNHMRDLRRWKLEQEERLG